jgi:hypothetical protein
MKTCIICVAKNESKYLSEWTKYHLSLGFDNIIIGNNDKEQIQGLDGRVIVIDYSGYKSVQSKAYTEIFRGYKDRYDWILFIDCDEFVVLDSKYSGDIKNFLSDSIFSKADIIRLHWKIFSGGKELDVYDEDYSVMDRFKEHYPMEEEKWGKSFIRTSSSDYKEGKCYGHGYFAEPSLVAVNSLGEPCLNKWATIGDIPVHQDAWINHYPTKTIGEYIRQKYFRGGANNNPRRYANLNYFFRYNEYSKELEDYGKSLIEKIREEKIKNMPPNIYLGYKLKPREL